MIAWTWYQWAAAVLVPPAITIFSFWPVYQSCREVHKILEDEK